MYRLFQGISHLPTTYPSGSYHSTVYLGGENTKILYTEVVGSLVSNAVGFILTLQYVNQPVHSLIDIAVGASGSEKIIINNLAYSMTTNEAKESGAFLVFPLPLPSGTRVAIRGQCDYLLVAQLRVCLTPVLAGPFQSNAPLGTVDTYGANTSDSGGVGLTIPSGSFSSWTEITSATTENYKGFFICLMPQGSSDAQTEMNALLEIGVGAAGSEVAIVDDLPFASSGGSYGGIFWPNYSQFFGIQIPSGTRISVRAKGSAAENADVILYGVR